MEKYKSGSPTPEVAAKLRPYLDQVFAPWAKGAAAAYDLDCRGGACRLATDDGEGKSDEREPAKKQRAHVGILGQPLAWHLRLYV